MSISRRIALGSALLLFLLTTSNVHAEEGIGKRIGSEVDQAIDTLREQAKEVASEVREGFAKMRAQVDRLGVSGRLYARLHWDKALNASDLSLEVKEGGVAVIRGTVANEEAKNKAQHLASDTVGVEQVVNELHVASKP